MKTLKKQIPYILLGATLLLLLGLNIISQDHWLDSDMAAEMIFSRILSEEHHIFSTTNWYYSTEFRVLYTQLLMENISQLSAVTEEVTANAEQVHTMSQNNLDYAEQVKTAVEHIRSTTDEMGIS